MMMVNHDDVYGPCSSPSLIMKNDPLLTDLSAPDIDESFLVSFDDDDSKEWLHTDQMTNNNGELRKEFDNIILEVSSGFSNKWGLNDQVYSAGAKQTLASSCYVDDRISVPSPPLLLRAQPSQLPDKAVKCDEYSSTDLMANDYCSRESLNYANEQISKRNLTSDLKDVNDKELDQFLSGKHVKRGRPMKITSRSKQALYAREYRRKNKIALWNYEKKVVEQNQEIAELMKQNEEMRKSLAEMTHQFNLIKRLVATSPAMSRQLQEIFGNV
uniref:BZIP domain-containing protein n=1 Tax=Syphacia muris TaxID=451379 RepID=A0A0N5AVV8_9BILA